MCTVAAPSLELISSMWTCDLRAVTVTLLLPELQTCRGSQHQQSCLPRKGARRKWFVESWAEQLGKVRGQYISCLISLWWQSSPAPHYPMLSRTWWHGSGLHTPIFFPCSGFGGDPTSQWLLQWQAEGWRHSLHPEGYSARTSQLPPRGAALAHPHALCAPAQLPEPQLLGMRLQRKCTFNALCLRPLNILLQAAQYSEVLQTNKGLLRISHSRGCKCSVQCRPADMLLAQATATAEMHLRPPQHTALALHPTGLGMGKKRRGGTGQKKQQIKLLNHTAQEDKQTFKKRVKILFLNSAFSPAFYSSEQILSLFFPV